MPTFCNTEGLFGLFDGGSNQEAPASLQEMIPRLLLEERTVKETRIEYLRYTLLAAQKELRDKGQKYGVDAALVHITRLQESTEEKPRFLLTAASCGEARTVLCRASGPLQLAKARDTQYLPRLQAALAQGSKGQKSGVAGLSPIAMPEPTSEEVRNSGYNISQHTEIYSWNLCQTTVDWLGYTLQESSFKIDGPLY
jgi:PH domain/leucine-rich repeat-containing protein phosphatase